MRDDFLRSVRACAVANGMDATAAATLERDLRKEYGGQGRYIARNAPADRADRRQRDATNAGGTSRPR